MEELNRKIRYIGKGFTNIFTPLERISNVRELGEITTRINYDRFLARKKLEKQATTTLGQDWICS